MSLLETGGVDPADFGRFTSDRHPDVVEPSRFDYAAATPILISVLPSLTDASVRGSVVRSLSTSAARPTATPVLIEEFLRTSVSDEASLKWATGNALATTADGNAVAALVDLARDPEHGRGRQMIVLRLGRAKKSADLATLLVELLDDPTVAFHAMGALRQQIGPEAAHPYIEERTRSADTRVRSAASQQLRKVDKALRAV